MTNRSRSGCLTCRIRRVKCDETLPRCRRCMNTGRQCEGPSKDKFTFVGQRRTTRQPKVQKCNGANISLHLPIRVSKAAQDPAEARAFAYFLACVAPSLSQGFDTEFWTLVLPQISEDNRAIRHAILAISDLYEHPPQHKWAIRNPEHAARVSETKSFQALTWYNQSLSQFQRDIRDIQDAEKAQLALLSCILFTSLEFQQNNVQNSLSLLGRGYEVFALAASCNPSSRISNSLVADILMPMFTRHVVLMACFGHHPPRPWTQRFQAMSQIQSVPMTTIREARTQLCHHVSRVFALIDATATLIGNRKECKLQKMKAQQTVIVKQLRRWYSDFDLLIRTTGSLLDAAQRSSASVLFMYFYVAEISILTCLDPSPMTYDEHNHNFENIVRHAEDTLDAIQSSNIPVPQPFSFEMGVIPPLYFTGWKCHHPLIRRRVLALIQRAPAQEALFSADLNYRATQKIIELEEGLDHLPLDLAQYMTCIKAGAKVALPKEADRVNGAMVQYENKHGEKEPPSLIYTKGRSPEKFAGEQTIQTVPI